MPSRMKNTKYHKRKNIKSYNPSPWNFPMMYSCIKSSSYLSLSVVYIHQWKGFLCILCVPWFTWFIFLKITTFPLISHISRGFILFLYKHVFMRNFFYYTFLSTAVNNLFLHDIPPILHLNCILDFSYQ